MHGSGFESAPVTQALIFGTVVASILASVTDTKHYFYLQISPHLWPWHQYWRLLGWQICYTNSTEVLFAAWSLYNLRVVERLWGSRKLLSFILVTLPYTLLLPPLISIILRSLTFGRFNYVPAGPTPLLFSLLAQYHAAVPSLYQYRIGTASTGSQSNNEVSRITSSTIVVTSKSTNYVLPAQLALSQFPSALLPAAVGWAVGYAYRTELIAGTRWRVPGWMVGQRGGRTARQMEELRHRLEAESETEASAISTGTARRGR